MPFKQLLNLKSKGRRTGTDFLASMALQPAVAYGLLVHTRTTHSSEILSRTCTRRGFVTAIKEGPGVCMAHLLERIAKQQQQAVFEGLGSVPLILQAFSAQSASQSSIPWGWVHACRHLPAESTRLLRKTGSLLPRAPPAGPDRWSVPSSDTLGTGQSCVPLSNDRASIIGTL